MNDCKKSWKNSSSSKETNEIARLKMKEKRCARKGNRKDVE